MMPLTWSLNMKCDWNLMRKIILAIEGTPNGTATQLTFDGYGPEEVDYHVSLVVEAGLARTKLLTKGYPYGGVLIHVLTFPGQEFAELARDEVRWANAMAQDNGAKTLDTLKHRLTKPASRITGEPAKEQPESVRATHEIGGEAALPAGEPEGRFPDKVAEIGRPLLLLCWTRIE
jgi:hypothetical protein